MTFKFEKVDFGLISGILFGLVFRPQEIVKPKMETKKSVNILLKVRE